MDWKLELVAIPVSDPDRAKGFYTEKLGFHADVECGIAGAYPCPNGGFAFLELQPRLRVAGPDRACRGATKGCTWFLTDEFSVEVRRVGCRLQLPGCAHFSTR